MNQLIQLRTMTDVVADTGDIEAIARYRPVDATTNPSLLLKAAKLSAYTRLLRELAPHSLDASDLADRFAVGVGCEILKLIPGRISTEVDARQSFDADASEAKAKRLVKLYKEAGVPSQRILIKLASTWEGIQAAAKLQQQGIDCNLTLLFSDVQAVAAAKAGAFLISPFVGRILDWYLQAEPQRHYDIEDDPGVRSVRNIYQLFKARGFDTVVMGASFRNIDQVRALAGCDRLTISPTLLGELESHSEQLPRALHPEANGDFRDCDVVGEVDFREQLSENKMASEKLAEGIRGFISDQVTLERLLESYRLQQTG